MTDTTAVTDPTTDPSYTAEQPAAEVQRFLTADDILGSDDRTIEVVDVPEWGGAVRVRALSGTERDAYSASMQVMDPRTKQMVPNRTNETAKLVARSVVKLDGERLFTDGQVAALGAKSSGALERVAAVAVRLSGLGASAEKDAEGNSPATQSGDSPSSEPTPPASPSVSG